MFSQKRDVNIPVNPGQCLSIEKKVDKVIFNCENNIRVSLKLISEDIIQVYYSQNDSDHSNKSFAVADSILAKTGSFDFSEQDVSYELYTGKLIVRIDKSPFKIKIYDKWQKLLVEDYKNQGYEIKSSGLAVTKILKDGERIYGLGEKNGNILRNGHKFKMWNSDKPCYSVNADPLYKSIPFFMSSEGYGIFFDNTFKTEFDFGLEKSDAYTFSCPGGEMVYYFIYGPTFKQIINNYTILTGKPIMPPSWAIGFAQSRGLLTNEKLTREIAKGFREREIPCDIIYQDIGWTQYLQDFNWRTGNYDNSRKMLSDLKRDGFKVIVSQDPVISKANRKQWDEADSLGYFALDVRNGKTYNMPWPWGGNCGIVDFTKPEVADWWGKYQQKVIDDGVKGFWTDMGEPAWSNEESSDRLYMKHFLGMHDEIHNVYGLAWDKVVTEQFEKLNPNQRIYQMTRSAYAGMQKYTFGWSGDAGNGNSVEAGWEQLAAQIPLSLSAGMGLIPFWSCDISGYCGDIKDYEEFSELYIRWMQFGAFNPLSRIHHEGNNAVEPWLFGEEAEKICKSAIELKYKLFPYIYTYSREAYDTGLPLMRALIIEYPSDKETYNLNSQFLFGKELLVAPITEKEASIKKVYLPEGEWIDFNNKKVLFKGNQWIEYPVSLTETPLFVKKGSIIPQMPIMQYITEIPNYQLILDIFPASTNRKACFDIYEDDGETNNYKKDIYAIRSIICISNKDNYEINYSERVKNGFKLLNRDLIYKIYLDNLPSKVLISDKKLKRGKFIIDKHLNQPNLQKESWSWDEVNNACIIVVPFNQASHKITIEK